MPQPFNNIMDFPELAEMLVFRWTSLCVAGFRDLNPFARLRVNMKPQLQKKNVIGRQRPLFYQNLPAELLQSSLEL